MSDDDLSTLARNLPTLDVDRDRAAAILARARRGPSPLRFLEPLLAAAFAATYLTWALARVVAALGY